MTEKGKQEWGGVLGRETLLELLRLDPPLVEGLADVESQVQPNGIDLSLRSVARYVSGGRLGPSGEERRLPDFAELPFDAEGWVELPPDHYLVTFNEVVHLPKGLTAIGRTRSTLLRSGVALHTAVWDAGYSGRSQSLMVVYNRFGFRVKRDTPVMQLIFLPLDRETEAGYAGAYQRENI